MPGTYEGLRLAARVEADVDDDANNDFVRNNENTISITDGKEITMSVTMEVHEQAVALAAADGEAKGVKQTNARMSVVLASEHYVGREALAQTMLTDEAFAQVSAEVICSTLAKAPKIEASHILAEDFEQKVEMAAQEQVKEIIKSVPNSKIDVNGGGNSQSEKADNSLVDHIKSRFDLKN